jgi:hypothetical protein
MRTARLKTTGVKYAFGAGLGGMLALAATTGIAHEWTGPVAAGRVAQYCVLPPDNPDAHRFYCGHADGWSGHEGATRVEALRPRRITMSATS